MAYTNERPDVDVRIEAKTEGTPQRVIVNVDEMSLANYNRLLRDLPADSDNDAERKDPIELLSESLWRYIGGRFIAEISVRDYQLFIVPNEATTSCDFVCKHVKDFLKNRVGLTIPVEQLVRG